MNDECSKADRWVHEHCEDNGSSTPDCAGMLGVREVCRGKPAWNDNSRSLCVRDAKRMNECASSNSDECSRVKARRDYCRLILPLRWYADLDSAIAECNGADEARDAQPQELRPDSLGLGGQVSDATQLRIPRLPGVLPSAFLVNLVGVGVVVRTAHVEFMPSVHGVFSQTSFTRTGTIATQSQSGMARGRGYDVGLLLAAGWFDAQSGGLYFSAYESYGWFQMQGPAGYSATVTEVSTDLGLGYKFRLGDIVHLDVFGSFVHVGVRPGQTDLVTVTSYPGVGVGVDVLGWP